MGKVCFTGYRREKLPFTESERDTAYLRFRRTLYRVIARLAERGYTDFISGVALGFDTWVAEDVLRLREDNSAVTLECAVPFPEQAEKWSTEDRPITLKILHH